MPAWLAVQSRKAVFFLTLYDIINAMKHFLTVCITPQPCHSHFVVDCCQFGPNCVGRINDKNNIARKRTYAETVANYVTPRVAPQIAIATHV